MVPTINWMNKKFDEFNRKYFDGKLSKCTFIISKTRNSWGQCGWKYKPGSYSIKIVNGKRKRVSDVLQGSEFIKLSKFYDVSEKHLEETFIHEMIHLMFIQTNRPYVAHGFEFRQEAQRISLKGIHKITVTDNSTFNINEEIRKKRKRVFRVVVFKNLKTGNLWYASSVPGISLDKLQLVIKDVTRHYSYFKPMGICTSDHDIFVGRQPSIKSINRWSVYKFSSDSDYEDLWKCASDKILEKNLAL